MIMIYLTPGQLEKLRNLVDTLKDARHFTNNDWNDILAKKLTQTGIMMTRDDWWNEKVEQLIKIAQRPTTPIVLNSMQMESLENGHLVTIETCHERLVIMNECATPQEVIDEMVKSRGGA